MRGSAGAQREGRHGQRGALAARAQCLGDAPLAHKLIPLGPPKTATESLTPVMKYKLSFTVPKGSAGKVLKLDLSAGASKVAETKTVVDS